MKKNFKIVSADNLISLTTIIDEDLELIRKWKNENRYAFFYDKIISSEEQKEWYKKYFERANDFILVIKLNKIKIGCIGFRLLEGNIDIYNVILGEKEYGGKGIMSRASQILYSYIIDNYNNNITLKVLANNNTAINWYKKNGFFEVGKHDNFICLQLDFKKLNYECYNLEF